MNAKTQMVMNYEKIYPQDAEVLLRNNTNNRSISMKTVKAYATDMINGNWDEQTSSPIAIDYDGILRDGQHRLKAIILANKPINMWVCRNVEPDGQYDNNRRRTARDQILITRQDLSDTYKNGRNVAVINLCVTKGAADRVTPHESIDFIDEHREMLDEFFDVLPKSNYAKVTSTGVVTALLLAYAGGVDMDDIVDFYTVLTSGMSKSEYEFPIIALRNQVVNMNTCGRNGVNELVARTQWALKKYLSKSCVKRNLYPDKLFWGYDLLD